MNLGSIKQEISATRSQLCNINKYLTVTQQVANNTLTLGNFRKGLKLNKAIERMNKLINDE